MMRPNNTSLPLRLMAVLTLPLVLAGERASGRDIALLGLVLAACALVLAEGCSNSTPMDDGPCREMAQKPPPSGPWSANLDCYVGAVVVIEDGWAVCRCPQPFADGGGL